MLLSLDAATVRFGGRAVLDAVGLDVAEHEVVCVLGPSGSGKSTLLRAVSGLQRLDSGRVLLGGHDQQREVDQHPDAEGGVKRHRPDGHDEGQRPGRVPDHDRRVVHPRTVGG